MFADSSCITITAFISPYRADRALARELHEKANLGFVEVFVDVPLHVAEQRDPKGLYEKARAGEIKGALAFHDHARGMAYHRTRFHGHLGTLRTAGDSRASH